MEKENEIEEFQIPKGSKFESLETKYVDTVSSNIQNFIPFIQEIFCDCWEFIKKYPNVTQLPEIKLVLVKSTTEFKQIEKQKSESAFSSEEAKLPAHALSVGNRFHVEVIIDLEFLINLLDVNLPTFILTTVSIFIHELFHSAFHLMPEQQIHDLECKAVESFLEIILPNRIKNIQVSDYYSKTKK